MVFTRSTLGVSTLIGIDPETFRSKVYGSLNLHFLWYPYCFLIPAYSLRQIQRAYDRFACTLHDPGHGNGVIRGSQQSQSMRYHGTSIENNCCHQHPSTTTQSIGLYDHLRVSPIGQSLFFFTWEHAQYLLKVESPCNIVAQ